jgi:fumarylacetoacetate (FAA) hydrolase family protein
MQALNLDPARCLPDDGCAGTLIARVWVTDGPVPGPSVAVVRDDGVFDLSAHVATVSELLEQTDAVAHVRAMPGRRIGSLAELLHHSTTSAQGTVTGPHLLAPCDLQVIKAAGVTFAGSLVERVIEERAAGDAGRAAAIRAQVSAAVGDDLRAVKPGSPQAMALKRVLQQQGLWSQYLEVGIGPDAEVFTKAPVLAAVGTGAQVGIRSDSAWNNPEPEVVLVVDGRQRIVGATLGNDVNLRDIEGRSALLLGKAKDNNASCALGPFIRLFDETFSLDDVRRETVDLRVEGLDGFVLKGVNNLARISRDPQDLVDQTVAAHQYPDGFLLFTGTLFAPIEDRDEPGSGFTHKLGDVVRIRSPHLGELCNSVTHAESAPPWRFGLSALFRNLAQRGLLRSP